MAKFLEGHYKGVGTFFQTLKVEFSLEKSCHEPFFKVENGTVSLKDGMGINYPLEVEYGDFGTIKNPIFCFPR